MGDRYEGGDNDAQQPEFKIYVGGLSFNSTKESISEAFSVAGKVTNVQLVLDKETGRLKGYGFVSFEDDKAYQYALDKMSGTSIDGRTVIVNKARTAAERAAQQGERGYDSRRDDRYNSSDRGGHYDRPAQPKTQGFRVSINNLPEHFTWRELKDHLRDATGYSPTYADVKRPGYGVGEFASTEQRAKAIAVLDGMDWEGSKIIVTELEMDRASSPDYEPRSQRSAPAYVGSSQRPRGDDSAPYREPRGPPPERSTRAAPYNDGYARSERPPASGYRESAAYKEPADYDEAPYRSGRGTAPASGPYKESSTRARYYEDERPSSGYKEGPSYREPAGYKEPYAGREAAYEKPMTKGGYREPAYGPSTGSARGGPAYAEKSYDKGFDSYEGGGAAGGSYREAPSRDPYRESYREAPASGGYREPVAAGGYKEAPYKEAPAYRQGGGRGGPPPVEYYEEGYGGGREPAYREGGRGGGGGYAEPEYAPPRSRAPYKEGYAPASTRGGEAVGYKEPAFYRDGPSGGPPRDSYGREPAYKDGPASGAYKEPAYYKDDPPVGYGRSGGSAAAGPGYYKEGPPPSSKYRDSGDGYGSYREGAPPSSSRPAGYYKEGPSGGSGGYYKESPSAGAYAKGGARDDYPAEGPSYGGGRSGQAADAGPPGLAYKGERPVRASGPRVGGIGSGGYKEGGVGGPERSYPSSQRAGGSYERAAPY